MSLGRVDPGPCPICGKEHTACTASTGPIAVVMTPARDATPVPAVPLVPEVESLAPLVSEAVPLAPGQFTTATYRGTKGKK